MQTRRLTRGATAAIQKKSPAKVATPASASSSSSEEKMSTFLESDEGPIQKVYDKTTGRYLFGNHFFQSTFLQFILTIFFFWLHN